MIGDDGVAPEGDPALGSIRQIAHEALVTFERELPTLLVEDFDGRAAGETLETLRARPT